MKRAKKLAAVLLAAAALGCLLSMPVSAGTSYETVDSSSFTEGLNEAVWNIPEADLEVVGGCIEFTADSTEYTRLIGKNVIEAAAGQDELLHFEATMNIRSIPDGGEFILACGLGSIESYLGDMGNVEVALQNDGGTKLTVRAFEDYGTPTELEAPFSVSTYGTVTLALTVDVDCTYTVTLNGATVSTGTVPYLPEGSVGLLQTGGCEVSVSDLYVRSYRYDAPENSNFKVTFDNDEYNANLLFSKQVSGSAYAPTRVHIDKYEGEDMLIFENCGPAHVSTMQQYSNFRITFDVPWLLRAPIQNEAGDTTSPASMWLGVSYGDQQVEYSIDGYAQSSDMILFDRDSHIRSFAFNQQSMGMDENHKFFDVKETRPFSCMVEVVDAHVKIGVKWMDEDDYTVIAEYDRPDGLTPLGYVHIWTCGPGNFAIDNIEMTNLDPAPNLVEVEYATNKFYVPEDYVWDEEAQSELIYRPDADKADGGKLSSWYLLIPCALVVAAVPVVAALIARGKKKKKEVPANENE